MNATEYLKQVRIAEQEMNAELRKAELYQELDGACDDRARRRAGQAYAERYRDGGCDPWLD